MLVETGILTVGAFLFGGVPFALLIGLARGVDIRKRGSGNVGATNLARVAGTPWGVLAFFFDAAKGYLPVILGDLWLGADRPDWALIGAGVAAVVGHCYSPYLRFRGGKGVATGAGMVLALHPGAFAILILVWATIAVTIRDIGVASSVAAVAGLLVGGDLLRSNSLMGAPRPTLGGLLIGIAILILFRHRDNIRQFWGARMGGSRLGGSSGPGLDREPD